MKVIIIGGSATGMGVAAKLRRNLQDAEIVVYQKSSYVSLGACGLPYLVGGDVKNENDLLSRSIEEFEKSSIKVVVDSSINKIDFDKKVVYGNGFEDTYDKLVIATGAKPIIPNIPGIDSDGVHNLTSLEDGVKLKEMVSNKSIKSIAVIGAGFIGVEVCEALSKSKAKINLIEAKENILSKAFDQDISTTIENELRQNGINVFKSRQVVEIISKDKKVSSIKFSDGETIETQLVIMSVGFQPNTSFLKDTNLKMIDNGAILVNKKGETNIKDVYSAGDCATSKHLITNKDIYSPLATIASKFAKVIADNISGKNIEFSGSIQSAMVKVFSKDAARCGLTELEAKEEGIDYQMILINDKNLPSYMPRQTDLSLKLIMNKKTRELIGAQIIGSDNSILRINGVASLIWTKTKVDVVLEQIDMPYAPPFSKTLDILHIALSKLNK
ncbi:CoA-disulfide reductase [Spiroplasma endosymbiont of Othius punctulatus]|uniref:CoA-disulfide reductase n=1 Tax=Spiroplasma endosymbiont of Othius punctulatus TaxID=3066289 RepID=UPI0030CF7F3D